MLSNIPPGPATCVERKTELAAVVYLGNDENEPKSNATLNNQLTKGMVSIIYVMRRRWDEVESDVFPKMSLSR